MGLNRLHSGRDILPQHDQRGFQLRSIPPAARNRQETKPCQRTQMLAKELAFPTELMLKKRLESSSGKKVSRVLVICKLLILRREWRRGRDSNPR